MNSQHRKARSSQRLTSKVSSGLWMWGLVVLACGAALCTPAFAHEPARAPAITVSGEAELSAPADLARLRVSVVSEDKQARTAADTNAATSDRVIEAVSKLLAKSGSVTTEGYSVTPTYRHSDGQRILVGYRATNSVLVETSEITQMARAIDAALDAGADSVGSLEFVLKDETPLRAEALRLASTRARAKAKAIAEAMGLEIVRTLAVEEQGSQIQYAEFAPAGRAMVADAHATPVAPGPVKVNARVVLRVEISD